MPSQPQRLSLPLRERCVVVGDINLVRALGLAGLRSAVAKPKRITSATLSRHCSRWIRVPDVDLDEPGFVRALVDYGRACSDRLVLFTESDGDTLAVSRHRKELEPFYHITLPEPSIVDATVDKLAFAELARDKNLPVPATLILKPGRPFIEQIRDWNAFPCIVKPALRSGWFTSKLASGGGRMQKALRCDDAAALGEIAAQADIHGGAFILQESIEGGEERVESYHAYVRPGGEIAGEYTGKKIRTYSRIHGASTCVKITNDPEVAALGRDVLAKIGFSGVVKLDFKRDSRDERLHLLEINPRFSLWHYPAAVAGVNIPQLVFNDALQLDAPKAGPVRTGVTWICLREDWKALWEYRAAGELTFRQWLGSVLRADTCHEFAWTDPLPGVAAMAIALAQGIKGLVKR